VRQWHDAQGKVTDWALDFANPHPDRQRITITAPATRDPGADITLQFTAPAGMDEVTWRATFGELGHGSWRTLDVQDVQPGSVVFSSKRVRQHVALVKIVGYRQTKIVAEGRAEIVITPNPCDR
jgi:hypothetical protein